MSHSDISSDVRIWSVVSAASLLFAYIYVHINMLNVINGDLVREFGFNSSQISQLFAALTFGNLVFLFPAGLLLDRFSIKKIILLMFAIAIFFTYLFAKAESYYVMLFSRFMVGAVAAFSFLSAMKLASRWVPSKNLALASGLVVTIAMFGGISSQLPFAKLTALLGWRTATLSLVYLGIFLAMIYLLVVKDAPDGITVSTPVKEPLFASIKKVLINSQNWFAGLYVSLVNFPTYIFCGVWGGAFLNQVHNFSISEATTITMATFIGFGLGSPLVGGISDRLGLRKPPMIVGGLLSVIMMMLITFLPTLPFTLEALLFFVFGFVASLQVLGYPVIAENNAPELGATATSIGSSLIVLAGSLVPIYGLILDQTDGVREFHSMAAFKYANLAVLFCTFGALLVALLVKETYCKRVK